MDENTTFKEVITVFESSFQDKCIIPLDLEIVWLKKAIAAYSVEVRPLEYDPDFNEFETQLDPYIVATLASLMKVYYQEREVSKINKRISIVGKDISYDGSGQTKKYASEELSYVDRVSYEMIDNQRPPAYN